MKKILALTLMTVFFLGLAGTLWAEPANDLFDLLNRVKQEINLQLKHTDRDLSLAAKEMSRDNLKPEESRKILLQLSQTNPAVIDCAFVNPEGIMKMVEPKTYKKSEGRDISSQEQMKKLRETKKPVASNYFFSIEKTKSLDFEYPINKNGKFLGSVSLMVNPEKYFGVHIRKMGLEKEKRYYWTVIQTDGTMLYDTDNTQIGKNVFTDPYYKKYPDIRRVVKNVTQIKSGSDIYTETEHHTQGTVQVYWDTVKIYGTEYKIMNMKLISEKKI